MKVIPFHTMYHTNYCITTSAVFTKIWISDACFTKFHSNPKTCSTFLYLKDCAITYSFKNGETLYVPRGSLIYSPQHIQYKCQFHDCKPEAVSAQAIHFKLFDENGTLFNAADTIIILNSLSKHAFIQRFDELFHIFHTANFSYSLLNARLLELMHDICTSYRHETIHSKTFLPIAKGILYLEHCKTHELSIAEIAKMCNISESCFRKLFRQYAGIGPNEYRTQKLMHHAEALLREGRYSVGEIAAQLGYENSTYFSKIFKTYYGLPPREYMKQMMEDL